MKLNAAKIRGILFEKRMTQIELANLTGLTRETVNAICNDKSCSYMSAKRIAAALDVDINQIKA